MAICKLSPGGIRFGIPALPSGTVSNYFMNDDGTVRGDIGDYHGATWVNSFSHEFGISLADGWAANGTPPNPFGIFTVLGDESSP